MVIDKQLILLDVEAENKEEAIQELGQRAFDLGRLYSLENYLQAVSLREDEYPTSVGYSVAIPHGKSSAVKEPFVVYGKLKHSIVWNHEEEDATVNTIFLLGVPPKYPGNIHLKILANLSRNIMEEEFREKLFQSDSVNEVYGLLGQIHE
ncbi:fructose-specific phosphotransferase system IIA component [Paenibacillus sp. RC73]|uniref:PTS sugar transporter subunit IIA n=1 Tax=Paenibacillus sp. RC73 TaxID=3156250 RepID=UPI003839C60A